MKENVKEEINKQINEEMYSAYLYLAMSAYSESMDFKGFANWMMVQYLEEMDHAMGFYHFLQERNERIELFEIKKPEIEYGKPLAMFEAVLEHEKHITARIHFLYELAQREKDYAFASFLKWYIDEQVEEEVNDNEIIGKLKMLGDNSHGIYMLDKELSGRTYKKASI